jgi:hypothetical protein
MGIKFHCPNGHKLHVKYFLAGKKGLCPKCGVRILIPLESVDAAKSVAASEPVSHSVAGDSAANSCRNGDITNTTALPTIDANLPDQLMGANAGLAPAANFEDDLVVFDSPQGAEVEFEIVAEGHASASVAAPTMPASNVASGIKPASPHDNANTIWYVHLPTGQRWGPANTDNISQWMQQGHIPATALIWRDGWLEWKLAADAFSEPKANPISRPQPSSQSPVGTLHDEPLVDVLAQAPASGMATIYRRSGRYPSANVTFVLLGLVVVLFAVMLYVFFLRDSRPKQSTFFDGHRIEIWERFALVAGCAPTAQC